MRSRPASLALILILLTGCAETETQIQPDSTTGRSSIPPSTVPSPLSSPSAAAPQPELAWSFGQEATTEAGGVALEVSGGHEFAENAASFDGRTGFAASSEAAPMTTTSSFSVSAWVSLADPVEFANVVSQVGQEAAAFYLGTGEGTWGFAMKDADTNEPGHTIRASADPGLLDVRTWTHLVGIHDSDANEIRLFVNGTLAAAVAFDQPWQAEGQLTIGRSQANFAPADFWPGSIASVAIYADALTRDQVAAIHKASGPSGPPPQVTSESAQLTGTWDHVFDDAGRAVILEDFAGLVDSADEVAARIGFDGARWWLGFVFDGELFLLDGVPEGDGGTFFLADGALVMIGNSGKARITYLWELNGTSLSLSVVEECNASGVELICTNDRSQMDPLMLLITDQTYTRSSDDPNY